MRTKHIIFALFTTLIFSASLVAQQDGPPAKGNNFDRRDNRGNIIARELGLSDGQKMQIRQINRQQRRLLRAAQQRMRTARMEADIAIYQDQLDQGDVELKIRNVAMAQAEITKIRLMSEVAVRNVLSPEQLVKFRTLREQIRKQQRRRATQRRNAAPRRRDGAGRQIDRPLNDRPLRPRL